MFLLITEIFGMKDFENVRGLCNLSILWGKDIGWMDGNVSNHYIWSLIVQQLKTFLPFPCPSRLLLPGHFLLLPAQLCQDAYHAILQAGSLNNSPKERGIGGYY